MATGQGPPQLLPLDDVTGRKLGACPQVGATLKRGYDLVCYISTGMICSETARLVSFFPISHFIRVGRFCSQLNAKILLLRLYSIRCYAGVKTWPLVTSAQTGLSTSKVIKREPLPLPLNLCRRIPHLSIADKRPR
ncbi:hypothetical protein ElyMa_001279700 [Elysia marginata]|uniref:Uncharacterized protein n=1 Tax=Elysia marginata TaxID=1093978 RepID=A0AAV4IIX8_9GAST|nr:hypothetical protein ElyMa_001279700 [Elysia marginata]